MLCTVACGNSLIAEKKVETNNAGWPTRIRDRRSLHAESNNQVFELM